MLYTVFSTLILKPIFLYIKKELFICLLENPNKEFLWLFTANTVAFSLQKTLLCLKKIRQRNGKKAQNNLKRS